MVVKIATVIMPPTVTVAAVVAPSDLEAIVFSNSKIAFKVSLSIFFPSDNGSAGDPALVHRDRVHWSRWNIHFILFFIFGALILLSSLIRASVNANNVNYRA